MTPVQRTRVWRGVHRGEVRAVVGARSALFLPFHELGLIVLDEEHDGGLQAVRRVQLSRTRHGGGAGFRFAVRA